MRGKTWLVVVAGRVLAGGVVMWQQAWRVWPPAPHVDGRLTAAALPVIDRYSESGRALVRPGGLPARTRPRWFCAEEPIETERRGSRVRVSLEVACNAYARQDGVLVTGAGTRMPLQVTPDHGGGIPVVLDVVRPVDGAGFRPSLERTFSRRGIAELDRRHRIGAVVGSPDAEAARVFGFAPGTKARIYGG
ncbi:hypothetical protein [Actinomadura montaniterrae]|uniref:Uncharacterized protein n=1 Tax=Actinomadura montaniterrae TaxID=1803903 RepID=A0A6L3WEL7_9ACTN|nr:hypothetical protein [Actinomadura montaniterrae]KAB2390466.1 hypothetical protein F9B16_01135 [Actinomadura montaniterrae]